MNLNVIIIALSLLDNHPLSELFYNFTSDLIQKAPVQTVSILIKQGQKLDSLKIINALIIPNPSERLVSTNTKFECISINIYQFYIYTLTTRLN